MRENPIRTKNDADWENYEATQAEERKSKERYGLTGKPARKSAISPPVKPGNVIKARRR